MSFLFLGCAGVLELGRATPLAPGEVRFAAGAAAGGVPTSTVSAGARFAAALHAGVAPGVEVGGGLAAAVALSALPLGFTDAAIDAKLRLGKETDSRVHVALNPRLRIGYAGASWSPRSAELPLLIGLDVGRGQLVAAPRAGLLVGLGEQPGVLPQSGMSLGWAVPVSDDLELLPAIGADWTRNHDETATGLDAGTTTFAGGISFVVVNE
ncbi:MAG: hypothetical protein EXR71_01980 [Myxococcales bacterium]|nr:hypothetical protein [Myxococcales bacterium]